MQEKREAREAGILAALAVLAAVLYMLFASPSAGVVLDGSSTTTMEQLGLTWAQETDGVGQRVEQFAYKDIDIAMLLKAGQPAVAWPAALVRLGTQPFGLPFDTRLLAVVYALVIAAGSALAVSGLMRHSRMAAFLWGVAVPVLLSHSAFVAYLNSLYGIGAAVAALLLFLGALVHAFSLPKGSGLRPMLLAAFAGTLLLTSMAQMLALLPFAAVGMVCCMVHCAPTGRERVLHGAASLFMLLYAVVSVTTFVQSDTSINSDAANYLAVFQGYMTAADEPADVLGALGVPEKYAADAGRSYYDAEESFAYSPRGENAAEELLAHIGPGDRLAYCLQDPRLPLAYIEKNPIAVQDAYNGYLLDASGDTRPMRVSPYSLLETIFGRGGFANHLQKTAAGFFAALLLLFTTKRRGGLRKLCLCFMMLFACSAVYLPLSVALTGGVDIMLVKVPMLIMGWAAVLFALGGALTLGQRVFVWLGDKNGRLAVVEPPAAVEGTLLQRLDRVRVTRKQLLWTTALVSVLLIGVLLLPAHHAGGVNNGDYGRMMEQIDLYWTQAQLDDESTQMNTGVVEDYTYREPFHPERLTSADPTYSLIFPSMVVRLWSALTGSVFSTWLLAVVMLLMTVAGILLIVHDLYPRLGRATCLLAACLVAMLLGENYVAWYNALFGESSISTGLVLTVACAVHLITMKRGAGKSLLWLALLAASVRFLTCAKAQMALALPAGLILLVALGIYHHPKGAARLTAYALAVTVLCGVTSWDTLGVYRKNQGVSEKQTVWQSVFYGALMIADDPDAAMAELGIDPVMKADIGKHAYYPEEDYVYAPTSEEAEEALYAKVNTMTMVKYYLHHPPDLLKMLDRAAQESVELHTGFMAYADETYAESEGLTRFNLWRSLRPLFACRAFWQYVLVYGLAVIGCLRRLLRKGEKGENRLLALLFLCIMLVGVLQFPLSVVGNGYADNNKQLYAFMLCHDLLLIALLSMGAKRLVQRARGKSVQERGQAS